VKIHPRRAITEAALRTLRTAWTEAARDLTGAEAISVLSSFAAEQIGIITKYQIRQERHGDTDKPGDVE
jgi:hypothetical protein